MSDLISKSKLIEKVNDYTSNVYGVNVDDGSIVEYQEVHDSNDAISYILQGFFEFFEIFIEQSTVDDKIIEQLEELKMKEYDDSDEEPALMDCDDWFEEGASHGRFQAYCRAIQIIKEHIRG